MVLSGMAQNNPPRVINRTNGANTVNDPRLMSTLNMIAPRYPDTTTANKEENIGIDSAAAFIFTHDVNGMWYRAYNPKRWVRLGGIAKINDSTLVSGLDTIIVSGGPFAGVVTNYTLKGAGLGLDSLEVDTTVISTIDYMQKNIADTIFETGVFRDFDKLRTLENPQLGIVYRAVVNNAVSEFYYDPSDNSSTDDGVMVIVTDDGARLKRLISGYVRPEWWGAKRDNTTDDGPAFDAMFRWIEATAGRNYTVSLTAGRYLVNTTVNLPGAMPVNSPFAQLVIEGNGAEIRSTLDTVVFARIPADQSAASVMISQYQLIIKDLNMRGNNVAGSVGMKLGAYYGPQIRNCTFVNLDTALVAPFWLMGKISGCFFQRNVSVDIVGCSGVGHWSGTSVANSSFNANVIEDTRFNSSQTGFTTIMLLGADQTIVRNCISEGFKPVCNFYMNDQNNTGQLINTFDGVWLESTGGVNVPNVNFDVTFRSTLVLKNIQRIYPDTIIKMNAVNGSTLIIDGMPYLSNIPEYPFWSVSLGSGRTLWMRNMSTRGDLSVLWNTIPENFYIENDLSANNGMQIQANNIRFRPGAPGGGTSTKRLFFKSSIEFEDDNTYDLGMRTGVTPASARPRRIYAGTGGLLVDPSSLSGIGFGTTNASGNTNVALHGWISTSDSTTSFTGSKGGIRLPFGTTAQRAGFNTAGYIRWNSDSLKLEVNNGSNWRQLVFTTDVWKVGDSTNYLTYGRGYKIADSLGALIAGKIDKSDSTLYASFGRLYKVIDSILAIEAEVNVDYGLLAEDGTLNVDSTVIASWDRLYKAIDSIAALIGGGGGGDLSIADSTSYLTFLRGYKIADSLGILIGNKWNKADSISYMTYGRGYKIRDSLMAIINTKLNISDTAAMLDPYARKSDLQSIYSRVAYTAGAGTTVADSITTETSMIYTVKVTAHGFDAATGDAVAIEKIGHFRNKGGTLVKLGEQEILKSGDASLSDADLDFAVDDEYITFVLTGDASASSMEWTIRYTVTQTYLAM